MHRVPRITTALLLALGLLAACTPTPEATDRPIDTDIVDTDIVDTDTDVPWQRPQGGRIDFQTSDGLTLKATYRPASQPGRPAILLLAARVQPDGNDPPWPDDLLQGFEERDWTVLLPDMRGTLESEGEWRDLAGGAGVRDIAMYADKVREDGYGEVVFIAGTYVDAPAVGYTRRADLGMEDVVPHTLVCLTCYGDGTEDMAFFRDLQVRPVLFVYDPSFYSTERWRRWIDRLASENPGTWEFLRYDRARLNTALFVDYPEATDDLLDFLDRALDDDGDQGGG